MGQAWKCSGLRWAADGPVLTWEGGRRSALTWGKRVAFGVAEGDVRSCLGARGNACPVRAAVPGRSTGARCEQCARLDRAHSVAADTIADDPRPYHVYLAWFGPGMVKVGITALERGSARLLEQGAVCFSWLGAGPLMAARRTEELLRAALGVPDRIPYADKRAVRSGLPESAAERAAEVAELHARAVALAAWPESLERAPCQVVDHVEVFGLAGVPAAVGSVTELAPGGVVSGRLVAAAGPDLHLATGGGVTGGGVTGGGVTGGGATGVVATGAVATGAGATGIGTDGVVAAGFGPTGTGPTGTGPTGTGPTGTGVTEPRETVVVLDTRLMTGWELLPVEADELTVPVKEFREAVAVVQDGLF